MTDEQEIDIFDELEEVKEELRDAYAEIERLRTKLERIADLSERWEDSLVSQINVIARSALTHRS